jgi:hypothetical protein
MAGGYKHRVEYYFDDPLYCLFDLEVVGSVYEVERSRERMKLPLILSLLFLFGCTVADATLSVKETPSNPERTINIKPNQCLKTDLLLPLLLKKYNEILIGSGTFDSTRGPLVMMLFTSTSGSWTLVSAGSNGIACALIWGENYRVDKPKKTERGI